MKSFLRYWMPVLVWLGLIFIGSTDLLSAEHTSRIIGPLLRWFNPHVSAGTIARVQFVVRKCGHLSEYAILAILLWRAVRVGILGAAKAPIVFLVLLITCGLFAASDEFHQSFVPSRTPAVHDVVIDICGAIIGLAICWFFAKQTNRESTI